MASRPNPLRSDPRIGMELAKNYRLESELGRGSMGVVYEASHRRLSRRFAIKMLSANVQHSGKAVERFEREARIASSLSHPNITEVVDFDFTPTGEPYIVMELLVGEDLRSYLHKRPSRPTAEQIGWIVRQLAAGLHAAHQQEIVHRDLKPSNVFVCDNGHHPPCIKVCDFGMSKVIGSMSMGTATQATIGTPDYMSPEQAKGEASSADARTDVFAVGGIVYFALSGRAPFTGKSVPETLYKVVFTEPARLEALCPGIPRGVANAVHRALAKSSSERFADMESFWRAYAEGAQIDAGDPFPKKVGNQEPDAAEQGNIQRNGSGENAISKRRERVSEKTQPNSLLTEPIALAHPRSTRRRRIAIGAMIILAAVLMGAIASIGFLRERAATEGVSKLKGVADGSGNSALVTEAAGQAPSRTLPSTPVSAETAVPPVPAVPEPKKKPVASQRTFPKKQARRRRARATTATLLINASQGDAPMWADVYIDGEIVGQSPLVKRLAPGKHLVEVRRLGFLPVRRIVVLKAGKQTKFVAHLDEK